VNPAVWSGRAVTEKNPEIDWLSYQLLQGEQNRKVFANWILDYQPLYDRDSTSSFYLEDLCI